jgi:O-antigen ligase
MKQEYAASASAVPLHTKVTFLLLAAMSSLPFLIPYHLNPINTFVNEWVAAALGMLAAVPLLLAPRSWQPLRFPLIALVPLGLAALAAIQVATGKYVYWQHHMLIGLYLAWAAVMMIVGSTLREQVGVERVVPVLAWALLGAGVVSALIVGLQLAGLQAPQWVMLAKTKAFYANLGQANHLANLLGLALASLLYLGVKNRIRTVLFVMLAIVLLSTLALTASRSSWLYLILLPALALVVYRREKGESGWLLKNGAMLIAAFIALQFVLPILLTFTSASPTMPGEQLVAKAGGNSVRLQLLEVAWKTFLTSPWLGVGFGQYDWHDFLLAEQIQHGLGRTTHAHNLFAQIMAEGGLAGLIIVVAGLGAWWKNSRGASWSAEQWWLFALLGILFIHSMLEYPLWYAYFLGLAALLLGMTEAEAPKVRFSLGPVLGLSLMVFGAFGLGNIGLQYMQIERWYQMRVEQMRPEFFEKFSELRKRGLWAPYLDHLLVRILPNSPQFVQDKLALNTRVSNFFPDRREVYNQATLLALNDRSEEAMAQLRRALARHPDEANRYAVRLLGEQTPATMPLLMAAFNFDIKRRPVDPKYLKGLKVKNPTQHMKSGKTPD